MLPTSWKLTEIGVVMHMCAVSVEQFGMAAVWVKRANWVI